MQESRPKQQWEVHLMVAPPLQAGEPGGSGGGWGRAPNPRRHSGLSSQESTVSLHMGRVGRHAGLDTLFLQRDTDCLGCSS